MLDVFVATCQVPRLPNNYNINVPRVKTVHIYSTIKEAFNQSFPFHMHMHIRTHANRAMHEILCMYFEVIFRDKLLTI